MTLEVTQIAKICHEANKAYCESLGDNTQASWDEAPENIKESAISGVRYAIENPHSTPADQHEAWREFKIKDGWIHGKEKDAEKKTHPCIVPYEALPEFQQVKDRLFRAIVKSLVN